MERLTVRKGIRNHKILIYDQIDELPIENFAQLEKNLLIEGGVGATINDFNARIQGLIQFISSGHKEKAMNEVNNMRNLFFNITQDVRPDMDAFSCLVYTINGEERKCTESGIEDTTSLLKKIGATKKLMDMRHDVKKKSMIN